MTKSLAITPRGLIVDNGKLIPVQYSIDMASFDIKPYITAMCCSPKDHFPEDLFPHSIAPLPGSFHFRGERISISPEHPLYRFFRWSALQIKYHMAMIIWYWLGERIEQEPSNADFYEERRQAVWPVVKNVFRTPNCGQPTIEDLAMTRRWNSIHSSPDGSFRSFPDQLDIQEHSQRMKRDGALVIKRFADQFPIQPDAPYVVIEDSEYCWLSYNWIHPLARWIGSRRCLEIMCGSGALSYALRTCGVQAIATDNFSWKKNFGGWYERPWTEIKQMDCLEAIRVYGPQTDLVVCSWPYMDDTCYHALLEMRKVNPAAQMLYIGEPAGGATASKAFFDAVTPVADEGFQAAVEGFRSAYMLKDMPMLFH